MTPEKSKFSRVVLASVIFGLFGFSVGFLVHYSTTKCETEGLQYINENLVCKEKLVIRKHSYAGLKNELIDFIDTEKSKNQATEIAIYFRDLQYGPTLGIDEHITFSPANLLKLPLLIAFENLKNDFRVNLWEEKIIVKGADDLRQLVVPEKAAQPGETYTIGELLSLMIKYSDNNAYYALSDYLEEIFPDRNVQRETLEDLGIIDPQDFFANTISVKAYSSIFTQLYNSSYFSDKESSDEVLRMLVESEWKNGLSKGVPENIPIAHKFGERINFDENIVQLHDCGIVYFPGNPYLLCVMTRGYDINTLSDIVGAISQMFYEEFNFRRL